ncbi:Rqc2 protein [Saccharomycopsis crataegensis]|uniref:Ribosome quality control complex subunit 2 n=1 Tax=Saccharomycopsis crataegensis TaxID=43959 RepID=A0AAV5QTT7_9ASCO|nr:Rqc2 protein [Saccharomycopsis crataegensis]
MKQRITSLDIKVLAVELRASIVGYRLQNIYNILDSDRIFSLKFSVPDSKKSLVVDYGFKLYLSEFERRLQPTPSNFVTKLRKHLKSKRLTNLKQVGDDRIIVLEFSNGLHYLVLEFFSAGNVILLNSDLEILSLQRVVSDKKQDTGKYAVRESYSMFDPKTLFSDSVKYFRDDNENENDNNESQVIEPVQKYNYQKKLYTKEQILEWIKIAEAKKATKKEGQEASKFHQSTKAKKSNTISVLKLLFLNCSYLSSDLLQRNFIAAGIDHTQPCKNLEDNQELLGTTFEVLLKSEEDIAKLLNSGNVEGFIVLKKNALFKPDEEPIQSALLGDGEKLSTEYTFEQFHPFKPVIASEDLESGKFKLLQISGYNKTLDKFFSSLDLLKNALKIQQSKNLLGKKLSSVKRENEAKIAKLSNLEVANYRKAELIILNADKIEQCKMAVQSSIDQGMDWNQIESMIEAAQSQGNEFASMIVLPLNLKQNKIKVRLVENEVEEEESDDKDDDSLSDLSLDSDDDNDDDYQQASQSKKPKKQLQYVVVNIDLSISAYANSKTYFDQKKNAQSKKEKTEKTAELAFRNSEKKLNATLKKDIEKTNRDLAIRKTRQKHWFEKFYWFISSENYLVIAPKDTLQLEMIYYKYFNSKHDYYVSSDIEGSLQVFVKNPYAGQKVPPSTLNQAGMFSLSASKAWSSNILTPAWYAEGIRVTKKDPHDGSLLPDGVLDIIGEKLFLPPTQLSMGLGLCWVIGDEGRLLAQQKREVLQKELGFEIVKEVADIKDVAKEKLAKLTDKVKNLDINQEASADDEKIESSTQETDNEVKELEQEEKSQKKQQQQQQQQQQQPKKMTRGKKSKLKKLQQKYADQDEEDRIIRLKSLGVLKQVENKDSDSTSKEAGKPQGANSSQKYGNAQRNAARQQKKYSEQFMDILEEDLIDGDYLSIFDSYSCKISSLNEKIIDVVPMFAPWQALSKFKYKVKIQPGSSKIGKSMNESLNYFVNRKSNKESATLKKFEGDSNKSVDSFFDFDLDFEFEHHIINQLKPVDLQPAFTVKGVRVILPSNANGGGGGKKNGGGSGGKGKKK